MSKIRRVDFSPDEWLAGTRNLEPDERGLYWDCCALIYSRGGPIADDERWLAKALAVDVRTWRRVRAALLKAEKLTELEIDGRPHLMNGRAAREIVAAGGRIEVASRGGKAKAAKAAETQDRANFGATSAGSSGDPPPKSGPISNEINGLTSTIINHQPSTTKEVIEIPSVTSASRADGAASPKREPKGTRLPDGWRPEGELRQWTLDTIRKAESQVSAGHELERFVDYWRAQPGAKGRKADWPATWRNWIRKAIEMEGKPNGSTQRSHQGATRRPGGAIRTAANFAAALGGLGGERRDGNGRDADAERMAGADILDPAQEP